MNEEQETLKEAIKGRIRMITYIINENDLNFDHQYLNFELYKLKRYMDLIPENILVEGFGRVK